MEKKFLCCSYFFSRLWLHTSSSPIGIIVVECSQLSEMPENFCCSSIRGGGETQPVGIFWVLQTVYHPVEDCYVKTGGTNQPARKLYKFTYQQSKVTVKGLCLKGVLVNLVCAFTPASDWLEGTALPGSRPSLGFSSVRALLHWLPHLHWMEMTVLSLQRE